MQRDRRAAAVFRYNADSRNSFGSRSAWLTNISPHTIRQQCWSTSIDSAIKRPVP